MSISDLSAGAVMLDVCIKAIEFGFIVFCYSMGRGVSKETIAINFASIARVTFLAVIVAIVFPFALFYYGETGFTKSIPSLSVLGFLTVILGFFNKRPVAE
jgi:hypothetical protein